MDYPFKELLDYYPRDYYWMYAAVVQLLAFITFVAALHHLAAAEKKLFSSLGFAFALVSATVLLLAYFIQFAVVPISMMKGETDGIALLTQYNGHGIFIAMEELGYFIMSLALFFLAFIFPADNRLRKAIRWVLALPLILNILAFVVYTLQFGIERSYRFEVASITIDWLFLIVGGILISVYLGRLLNHYQ